VFAGVSAVASGNCCALAGFSLTWQNPQHFLVEFFVRFFGSKAGAALATHKSTVLELTSTTPAPSVFEFKLSAAASESNCV